MYGLYIEGAKFNFKNMELDESDPKVNIYYIKKKNLKFFRQNQFFFLT